MKGLLVAAVGLLIPALVQAQSLAGLPACAQTCAFSAVDGSDCAFSNTTCICESKVYINTFNTCIGQACNATEQTVAKAFGVKYCKAAGITVSAAPGTANATSTPAASTGSASTGSAGTASTGTVSAPAQTASGAAVPLEYSWAMLGFGGLVALGA